MGEVSEIADKAKKKAKRGKQTQIPGTERKTHPAVEKAAIAYAETRDARMELNDQEQGLKGELREVMKKHGVTYQSLGDDPYEYVEIVPGEDNVKVKGRRKVQEASAEA